MSELNRIYSEADDSHGQTVARLALAGQVLDIRARCHG